MPTITSTPPAPPSPIPLGVVAVSTRDRFDVYVSPGSEADGEAWIAGLPDELREGARVVVREVKP